MTCGIFPDEWKVANIIPLPTNPRSPDKLKPVLLLSVPGKILELLIHDQLFSYLEQNQIFHGHIYGFRTCKPTRAALTDGISLFAWPNRKCCSCFQPVPGDCIQMSHAKMALQTIIQITQCLSIMKAVIVTRTTINYYTSPLTPSVSWIFLQTLTSFCIDWKGPVHAWKFDVSGNVLSQMVSVNGSAQWMHTSSYFSCPVVKKTWEIKIKGANTSQMKWYTGENT